MQRLVRRLRLPVRCHHRVDKCLKRLVVLVAVLFEHGAGHEVPLLAHLQDVVDLTNRYAAPPFPGSGSQTTFGIPTVVGRLGAVNRLLFAVMLGDEIRKARLKANLTQEELAFRAGISRQYVSLLELDQKSPTLDVLIRLCKAMDASAAEIVSRVENARH